MTKQLYRFLALFIIILTACIFVSFASAEISKTADEAVAWVMSHNAGQGYEYDGYTEAYDENGNRYHVYPQCVDLIVGYMKYIGGTATSGNGADYASNWLPDGYERIQKGSPQKGDILVWTYNEFGHVAIVTDVESNGRVIYSEQNVNGDNAVHHYSAMWPASNDYWGVIRPDFISDTLSIKAAKRGNEVDLSWSRMRNVSGYHFLLEYVAGGYSDERDLGPNTHTLHYGLSEGKWRATVTVAKTDGSTETATLEFELGKMNPRISTSRSTVNVSWDNLYVDSYWVLVVTKATDTSVYSNSVGNVTSASFSFSDGDYIMYVSAVLNGSVLKSESIEFTVNSNLVVSAITSGSYVDVSWTDYDADSYYAWVVIKGTDQTVYGNNIGNTTATTFQFSEGDYSVYITAVKNGQNIKSGVAHFSIRRAAASVSRQEVLEQERFTLNCNVESFDSCILHIYRDGNPYADIPVTSQKYDTGISVPGNYSAVYSFTKGTISYNSIAADWTVKANDYGILILPEETTTIESKAFAGLTQGTTVILTDKVRQIEKDAFEGSTVLLSVPRGSYAESYCVENQIPYRYEP